MSVQGDLGKLRNPAKAQVYQRFFKTGPGEYGEGDRFLGITVPEQRMVAKKHALIPLLEVEKLLESRIHEHRLTGLLILVEKFKNEKNRKKLVDFYLKHLEQVNNWDLVDLSADKILGMYLIKHPNKKPLLKQLARSSNLWKRRIAVIATFAFIKNNQFQDVLQIATLLLKDDHDLIHKAVGWMLREVGKRSVTTEERFLKKHYKEMPRTMLRYAIERFPPEKKRLYMRKG